MVDHSLENAPAMGLRFTLTGYSVVVGQENIKVHRTITTQSNAPTSWVLALADAASSTTDTEATVLREPSRFAPGTLALTKGSPEVRVMPSAVPVAKLLLQFIRETAETSRDETEFERFAKSWLSANAAAQPDIAFFSAAAEAAAESAATMEPTDVPEAAAGDKLASEATAGAHVWSEATSFVGFDVETANEDEGSIIQFGVAVVEKGQVIATHSWLCRPPRGLERFDEENIGIHGITAADVAGQPTFVERFEQFVSVVGERPVVAHNARFDFTALAKACRAEGIKATDFTYSCTYRWARQAQLGLPNLKLPTLAAAAGFNLENHHDASADALACASIALWLMKKFNTDSVQGLNQALSLRPGTLTGTRLTQVRWDPTVGAAGSGSGTGMMEAGAAHQSGFGGSGTNNSTGSTRSEGAWQKRRNAKWDAAKTPDKIPDPNPNADPNGLLFGQRVTLTGDFAPFDKGQLWDKIADAGANINKGVTKKTTILVAGPWDSVTSKEKRARALQEEGQAIEIWSEKELYSALGMNPNTVDEEA